MDIFLLVNKLLELPAALDISIASAILDTSRYSEFVTFGIAPNVLGDISQSLEIYYHSELPGYH